MEKMVPEVQKMINGHIMNLCFEMSTNDETDAYDFDDSDNIMEDATKIKEWVDGYEDKWSCVRHAKKILRPEGGSLSHITVEKLLEEAQKQWDFISS